MTGPRDPEPMDGLTCDEVRDLAAAFVLGALDDDEAAMVRAHLATCPDAHAEMAELAAVLPVLAESVPVVAPPAGLGARIRAAAEAEMAATEVPAATAGVVPFAPSAPPAVRRPGVATWALRIAAVVAIVALGAWNLSLQGQLSQSLAYEQAVTAVLEVAGQPGSLTAVLTAEGGAGPSGLAAVSASGDVTLAMQGLAPTSGDQVYETWVIGGDGVPLAIGGFVVGANGTATFVGNSALTEPGIVLALTLEPAPGATVPSGPVVSSGTAGTAG